MSWIVAPDEDGPGLPAVLPSLLAAMGVDGFTDALALPRCGSAAALLVDGLGWNLLREHADDAPFLAALATRDPIKAGFPTTTVTSITSLNTGRCAGEHGLVGYTFADPSGGLLHPLSWEIRDHAGHRHNATKRWPPEETQPVETIWDRAARAGVAARIAVPAEFRGTGLTRAGMRGAEFRGLHAMGDLAAEMLAAVSGAGPSLCYGYHGHLDMLGHLHGPGSLPWRVQLTQIDRLVESIVERLPSSAALVVVADHGMVDVDPVDTVDIDADPSLLSGVRLIGGEGRARHVYTETGATADVLAAWREVVGDRGVVVTAEEAIGEGWFGPTVAEAVRARIGDVITVMREGALIRSAAEPRESALRGQHGSLTADEQYVPLLVATG